MPSADQLIYTRVTGTYSPTGQEGYQVVHRSDGLTDSDIQQISALVESIPDEVGQQRRFQFFRLPDRRVVVSLSGVVAAAPKISDPRGRSALLAHVLIVTPEAFSDRLLNDPFELLNQGELWVTSPQEMANRFAKQGAIIAPAKVGRDPDPYGARDPREMGWQPRDWNALVALARNAAELVKAGKTVFFRGSPDDAAEVLRPLLLSVRTKKRGACTFNTACGTDSPQPGMFWAVAGASPPNGADCVEVDLDGKQVQLEGLKLDLGTDVYERWVNTAVENGQHDKIRNFGEGIEILADTLVAGEQIEKASDLRADLIREFYDSFSSEVKADLQRRLNGWLTKRLADGLMGDLEHAMKLGLPPWWLSQTEWEAGLTDWLAEWIARAQPSLGRADRAKLRELGAKPGARALAFWGLSTGFWPKHSSAHAVLGEMTDAEFATAARLLGHVIPAARYVHEKHLPALVATLVCVVIPEKELIAVIIAILREGNPKVLDPLAKRVAGLSAAGVQRLAREVASAGAEETEFGRAVASRMSPRTPDQFPTAAQPG